MDILEKVAKKFKTPEGKIVDMMFKTSDGQLFFDPAVAQAVAAKLNDKSIVPYYKDTAIREMAKKLPQLDAMVVLTDFIKLKKLSRQRATYEEYIPVANERQVTIVPKETFDFVLFNVWTSTKPVMAGMTSKIYTYDRGIVPAVFLMRYEFGQIWQENESIVLTCPTNTELMRTSTYREMFKDVLG